MPNDPKFNAENAEKEKLPESGDQTNVTDIPWGLIGREYGKFNYRTRVFIRWRIVIVGIFFAVSYISEQLVNIICHWCPDINFCMRS